MVMSRKVITETVEKRGGMQTTTTRVTCSEQNFDEAFRQLDLDPTKFRSGGTSVTRQIIYTNSDGQREVLEETVETYGESKPSLKVTTTESKPTESAKACAADKKGKSFTEKLGLSFGKSSKNAQGTDSVGDTGKGVVPKKGQFEEECLKKHNEYRRKHGVPDLVLSDEICSYSKEWASHLADTDTFKHRTERKYGENIYMKWSSDPSHMVTGAEAVNSWYDEIKDHVFGQEPRSLKSGHFTQVIWKGSKQLGVAWARSKSGKILVVANYDPPGNFVGSFSANVPPPKN